MCTFLRGGGHCYVAGKDIGALPDYNESETWQSLVMFTSPIFFVSGSKGFFILFVLF